MGVIENRRFCPDCGRQTWHVSRRFSPEGAFLLALITGGLFLLVWFMISIMERNQPWVCRDCSSADAQRGKRPPRWLSQRSLAEATASMSRLTTGRSARRKPASRPAARRQPCQV